MRAVHPLPALKLNLVQFVGVNPSYFVWICAPAELFRSVLYEHAGDPQHTCAQGLCLLLCCHSYLMYLQFSVIISSAEPILAPITNNQTVTLNTQYIHFPHPFNFSNLPLSCNILSPMDFAVMEFYLLLIGILSYWVFKHGNL